MSAAQLGVGTAFEVKCLFAIDAIAAVYRAGAPFFRGRRSLRDAAHRSIGWLSSRLADVRQLERGF
jgi:hypothetical protein